MTTTLYFGAYGKDSQGLIPCQDSKCLERGYSNLYSDARHRCGGDMVTIPPTCGRYFCAMHILKSSPFYDGHLCLGCKEALERGFLKAEVTETRRP